MMGMPSRSGWNLAPLRLCILRTLACLAVLMGGMVQVALAADPITEVDVFARGNLPALNGPSVIGGVTIDTNGFTTDSSTTPIPTIRYNTSGPFISDPAIVNGNPGIVTTVFNFTATETTFNCSQCGGPTTISHVATVTITVDVNTGAVTASGSDPDNIWFGSTGNIDLVSNNTTVSTGVASSFNLSTTVDITQRTVRSCVNFPSGLQACTDVFPLNVAPPPTPNSPAQIAAQQAANSALASNKFTAAFQLWTDQLSNVMLYQLQIIGQMLDAKHMLETERLFGATEAESHRDYAPSEQICAFGTLARASISKNKMDSNITILDTILQKREVLNAFTASSWGPATDFKSRMERYKNLYCDKNDMNGNIAAAGICAAPVSLRINKDISYRGTMENKMTMDVDFTDTTLTPDEEDVLALAKNLYASTVLTSIPERSIAPYGKPDVLQDSRMLSAVRSVERASFANAVAMRATGSGLVSTQLGQIMQNLGVAPGDVASVIGANPSYFAQMDLMTQKMFQAPNFYTNLYDNPANVARMKVVLQAVRLMADRDKFEQSLRREMLISMLLEMRLRQAQESVNNQTTSARSGSQ